ncbi:MAG: helix-turn-helix domain-containing protein, partial [Thermoguttaceae bacterium]
PLSSPGPDARRAILREWCSLRQLDLAEPILDRLAHGLSGTVPELLGAMMQLEVPARDEARPIDGEAVRRFLAKREEADRPQIGDIAAATARYFSLRLSDLRGQVRRRPVVVARHVAMLLARRLTKASLQRIGEYFGRRDHTTVMHGCRKAGELLQSDPAIRQAVDHLCRSIGPRPRGSHSAKRVDKK